MGANPVTAHCTSPALNCFKGYLRTGSMWELEGCENCQIPACEAARGRQEVYRADGPTPACGAARG